VCGVGVRNPSSSYAEAFDARDEFSDDEPTRRYAVYNGRDASGGPAAIGIQARDKLIREIVDEIGRQRSKTHRE